MKRLLMLFVMVLMAIVLLVPTSRAEQYGLFTYSIKADDTIIITGFDWYSKNDTAAIEIPSEIDGHTITEIGEYAFAKKSWIDHNLEEKTHMYAGKGKVDLIIPNTITTIGAMAFFGSDICLSGIPASVEEIGYGAFSACTIKQFKVDGNNPAYTSVEGALYCKKTKELIAVPCYANIHVPNGVVKIAPWACSSCESIKLYLPETLEEIGEYAFWGGGNFGVGVDSVSSRRIVLPNSVKVLGQYAFACMWNNGTAEYPLIDLSQTQITELPDYAFYKLNGNEFLLPTNLEFIGESAIDAFCGPKIGTLPDSLRIIRKRGLASCYFPTPVFTENSHIEEIGDEAFSNCYYGSGAKSMVLPNTLHTIGSDAFKSVTLEKITIPASVTSIAKEICNREKITLIIEPGSYAEQWAYENNYVISGSDDLSWLD